ncbi:hypothetical protein DYH09_30215 [bacterium CPR1]|nr:hypothetical protein [bacterium CPR1]
MTSCKSNLKNIATALEMYSSDNEGRYPVDLGGLTPNYLKVIPGCAATGKKDTYSGSYEAQAGPDSFTIFCKGENHTRAGYPRLTANFPQYTARFGLVESERSLEELKRQQQSREP